MTLHRTPHQYHITNSRERGSKIETKENKVTGKKGKGMAVFERRMRE